jgi:hypothetical protein
MDLHTLFGGTPDDWVCRHGAPSALGMGMPSYESDDRTLQVFDTLLVQYRGPDSTYGPMMFPRSYGVAALLAPEGLVPLHHSEDAWWGWRPWVYERGTLGRGFTYLGSQAELAWRHALNLAMMHDRAQMEKFVEAGERAQRLLVEHLTPQQQIDLLAYDNFRVTGAKTKNQYAIQLGRGFAIIDRYTTAIIVSYCFHTEHWMPDADVALATKLALEDEELEVQALETAKIGGTWKPPRPQHHELVARKLECDYELV